MWVGSLFDVKLVEAQTRRDYAQPGIPEPSWRPSPFQIDILQLANRTVIHLNEVKIKKWSSFQS